MVEDPAFDIIQDEALSGVPHGFLGHSGERYQFGFGGPGDPGEVRGIRAAIAHELSPNARILTPHQVHSPDVLTVTEPWEDTHKGRPTGDAVVTNQPGLVIGVVTADCAPVLFADRSAGVVGAAHAGWRGAHGGVLENTLAAMECLGADRSAISVAIGPTIAQASYEVDIPFRDQFADEDERFFSEGRPGHWQFDLPGYIAARLAKAGLGRISLLDLDTYSNPERFYSYRRASQTGAANYGRQISVIAAP